MADIQDIVREGWQSIGKRALALVDGLYFETAEPGQPLNPALITARDKLQLLSDSGEPDNIGMDTARINRVLVNSFKHLIPPNLIPEDARDTLDIGFTFACDFFDTTPDKLKKAMDIDDIYINAEFSGIGYVDGKRAFIVHYSDGSRIQSVVGVVQAVFLAMHPDVKDLAKIIDGKKNVFGFGRLANAISRDDRLSAKHADYVAKMKELHFYLIPEVMDLAEGVMYNFKAFREFIFKNLDRTSFLSCNATGAYYVKAGDVIAGTTLDESAKQVYQLASLMDAIEAVPMGDWSADFYRCSIGLAEYIRKHPEKQSELRKDADLHDQITRTAFSDE